MTENARIHAVEPGLSALADEPTRGRVRPGRLAPVAAFALPLLVYALGLRYLGSGDTVPAELLPISVLTEGNLDFNEFQSTPTLPYWFRMHEGRVISSYPILPGLLNVPVYAVARAAGMNLLARRFRLSLFTSMLLAAFSVLFVYLALLKLYGSSRRALGFAFVYAFGTGVWSVASHGLFQHGPALFFLTGALALIASGRPKSVALSGFCLSLAVLARPTNVALASPLALVVALRHRKQLLPFLGLAAVPATLHALYCWRYLGTPWSLGQDVPAGNFTGNPLQGLAGLLVSPSRGLLVFSPVLVFAIPAAVAAFRRSGSADRLLERCLVLGTIGVLAVYAFWSLWWGGHSFGYRLILELSLPLVVLIASDWPRIRESRLTTGLFVPALAASIVVQALGSFAYPSRFNATVDQDPSTLWDVCNSELVLSTEKLLRGTASTGARGLDPGLASSLAVAPAAPRPHWWDRTHDDEKIPLSVDAPAPDALVRGTLTVHGWAQPLPGDPGEVWITVGPGQGERRADRFPRFDVARAIPTIGDGSRAGFGARFEPTFPHLVRYTLLVEVRAADGMVRRSAPISFLWAPARTPR